ncbi:hypothetical protein TNCV_2912541 [Trichonephila clavipes]|nr:hypothetical protein TNCV_2912541 [Trichonephila clavipes]
MDALEQSGKIVAACLKLEISYGEIAIITSRPHLIEELRWRFNQEQARAIRSSDDDICYQVYEGKKTELWLNSDTLSLETQEGWYQGQPRVEGFTNVAFIRWRPAICVLLLSRHRQERCLQSAFQQVH